MLDIDYLEPWSSFKHRGSKGWDNRDRR